MEERKVETEPCCSLCGRVFTERPMSCIGISRVYPPTEEQPKRMTICKRCHNDFIEYMKEV